MTTPQGARSRLHRPGPQPGGRHEEALHWGAASGAVLLAAGGLVDTILGAVDAGALTSHVHVRLAAGAMLMVGCGLATAGVCVHLDTVAPRRLSWVAVVIAVLGWVSVLPACWVLVTGGQQVPVPVLVAPAVGMWLPLVGVAALIERTWHPWLGALTVAVAGVLWAGWWITVTVGGLGSVMVAVTPLWAAVFAVAQVVGPHPDGASRGRNGSGPVPPEEAPGP